MLLPHIAAVILGLGALVGAYLAITRLRGKTPSLSIAIVHGLLVAPGLLILLYAIVLHGRLQNRGDVSRFDEPHEIQMGVAAAMFILAAIGGLYMFIRHGRGRHVPLPIVVIHGLAALTAYTILLIALFSTGLQRPMPIP